MVWTVNSTLSWAVYRPNCLTQWNLGLGWVIVIAKKTDKVPIHKKLPNLLTGLKACPRKGEERMEWEGRKEGAQWVHYIIYCTVTTNQPVLWCKHQFARNGQFSEFHIFAPQNAAPPWKVTPGANAPLPPPPAAM